MLRFLFIALTLFSSQSFAQTYDGWYKYTAEEAKRMIENGFDVNSFDKKGKPAIFYAVLNEKDPGVLSALLQAGADPNITDAQGTFPLFLAATKNQKPNNIIALLRAGADVNKRIPKGVTSLMIAANLNKNPRIIATLIQGRADETGDHEFPRL